MLKKITSFSTPLQIPILMPDEIWTGYFGRLLLVNDIKNKKAANYFLTDIARQTDPNLVDAPLLMKIALISNTTLEKFVQHHTLIPLLRPIIGRKTFKTSVEPYDIRALGNRSMKKVACFCKDCVTEDIDYLGFSFWRRSHQLIGLDWCFKHNYALCLVDMKNAMHSPPCVYLKNANYKQCVIPAHVKENPYVKKFNELILDIADSSYKFDYRGVAQIFSEKAIEFNLRICKVGRRNLISDLLIEVLPFSWMRQHFPHLNKSIKGQFINEFDGALLAQDCTKIINILLIASVLLQNADNVLYILKNHIYKAKCLVKNPLSRNMLIESYIKHKGNIKKVAKETSRNYLYLTVKFKSLGCPPLGGIGSKTTNALIDFYDGIPISEILIRTGINIKVFSRIIQMENVNVAKALKQHKDSNPY